jgi:hypothetical protein
MILITGHPDPVEEIIAVDGNTQNVRLLDVFLLGPLMIYVASKYRLRQPERALLFITGIATITTNGINYLNVRERAAKQ